MNKTLLAIASVCVVIALLSPIAVYVYFNNIVEGYKSEVEFYKLQSSNPVQEYEELKEKTREFMKPYDPYLNEPYLATEIGWYLHNSSDPVEESRNEFTIYGRITNIGAKTAYHCTLTVKFYSNNAVIQTSEVYMGIIDYWSQRSIYDEVIGCQHADSVTKIGVERTWTNTP